MEDLGLKSLFGKVYKNKKVLITGHSGFKGSWLALWLVHLGAKVVGYSLGAPSVPSHFELLNLKIRSLTGDIRDRGQVEKTVRDHEPDIIFHLAAQPLVLRSYQNPQETFETNMMGAVNVLEACRRAPGVRALINITSDKCYENRETAAAYREEDRLGGRDPYSASKACSELITEAYRKSFFELSAKRKNPALLVASVRAGNVIGGGDWAENRLFPDVMRAVSKNERTVIRSPWATRPWQHVLEPLSGYLLLGQKLLEGKSNCASAWNFSPPGNASLHVIDILRLMQKEWPEIKYRLNKGKLLSHEAQLLQLSSRKAHSELCWRSVWNIPQSVQKTVAWYKDFYSQRVLNSQRDLCDYVQDARRKKIKWAS